jgi:hypothetical protein
MVHKVANVLNLNYFGSVVKGFLSVYMDSIHSYSLCSHYIGLEVVSDHERVFRQNTVLL